MKVNSLFDRLYYVHNNGQFDSRWIGRRNARSRKAELKESGATNVTISYVPVSYGSITLDSHS